MSEAEAVPGKDLILELSPALKTAVEDAHRVAAEQARIEAAMSAARSELTTAEAELEAVRRALASTEAEAALGGQTDRQARKNLVAARDQVEFASAKVAGLEERRNAVLEELRQARYKVDIQWRAWSRETAARILDAFYLPLLEEFLAAARLLTAAGSALNVGRLVAIARGLFVADPEDPLRNLANPKRSKWQDDPEAAALYQQIVDVHALVGPHLSEPQIVPALAQQVVEDERPELS